MRLGVHEIVAKVGSLESDVDKVNMLRSYDSGPLRTILRYAYDSRIEWLVPDGEPPYTPLPTDQHVNSELMFLKEARTMYLFVQGDASFNPNVSPAKREALYLELLEVVHPADARLIIAARNGAIPGVSYDVVDAAFPGLIAVPRGVVAQVVANTVKAVKKAVISEERMERRRIYARNKRARMKAEKLGLAAVTTALSQEGR